MTWDGAKSNGVERRTRYTWIFHLQDDRREIHSTKIIHINWNIKLAYPE
jgi:hypothetical protein